MAATAKQPTTADQTAAQKKYGNVPLSWNGNAYTPTYTNSNTGQAYGSYDEWYAAQQSGFGSTTTQPTVTTPVTNPTSYSTAYQQASQEFGGDNSGDISAYATAAQNIATASAQKAADIKAEIPATQNIYSDIANLLSVSEATETGQVKQEQTQATSSQAEAAAEKGFNPNTGYEAALSTATNTTYNTQLQGIANKYNLQFDQVAQEESKAIGDLVAQADDAILQGDVQTASMLKDVITLKQNQQQIVQTAAQSILTAGLEQEKMDISKYTPVTVYNPATGTSSIVPFNVQTGQVATGTTVPGYKGAPPAADKNPPNIATITTYGANLGVDAATIQSAIAYGQANGLNQGQIEAKIYDYYVKNIANQSS